MSDATTTQIAQLQTLRLPELQARFAEVVGEATRCPNRRYLVRRIAETLAASEAEVAAPKVPEQVVEEQQDESMGTQAEQAIEEQMNEPAPQAANAEGPASPNEGQAPALKLTQLTVEELQARHLEVIGRPTSSHDKPYLVWRLRQAAKGKIPIGPRRQRQSNSDPKDHKVLPLRMEADIVTRLDEARVRLGLKSRMDLIRRALHVYLDSAGEGEVAALFATEG